VAIGTKFVELGLTPSDSYKFYAPHRKALFDKRLKNHSPEGFEMASSKIKPGLLTGLIRPFAALSEIRGWHATASSLMPCELSALQTAQANEWEVLQQLLTY